MKLEANVVTVDQFTE